MLLAALLVPVCVSANAADEVQPVVVEHAVGADVNAPQTESFVTIGDDTRVKPWEIVNRSSSLTINPGVQSSVSFDGLGFAEHDGAVLTYELDSGWRAQAGVDQQSWYGPSAINECYIRHPAAVGECNDDAYAPKLLGSSLGASYQGDTYGFGVGINRIHTVQRNHRLPQVLLSSPLSTTVNGVAFHNLSNSTSIEAHGSMRMWDDAVLDVGASVGRMNLATGNHLNYSRLGQKSLSVGVRKGGITGRLVGRIMEPQSNVRALGNQSSWSSVDLGVTWQLPREGSSLSFGAQNLWSSGDSSKSLGSENTVSDRSRIPFVQYHQDF